MSDEYVKKFYDDVCNSNDVSKALEGEYKIILEPNRKFTDEWVEYDQVKWELDEEIEELIEKLKKDDTLNFEDKVLSIHKYLSLKYVYDDNVLFFFKEDASDPENIKYIAVDFYGRIIDEKWKENRKKHNKRVCYEFSRIYAKAINKLIDKDEDLEAFLLGDRANLHYVVGLAGKDYSVILDVDDFIRLKDLTRVKLGLTIEGVRILRDEAGKFRKAVDKFNEERRKELLEVEEAKKNIKDNNIVDYFKEIVEILKKYNIDSQGFWEYMRVKLEDESIEIEKIWKEVKGGFEKRYSGCLIFYYDSKTYLIDCVEKTLKEIDKEKLDKNVFVFNSAEHQYKYFGG